MQTESTIERINQIHREDEWSRHGRAFVAPYEAFTDPELKVFSEQADENPFTYLGRAMNSHIATSILKFRALLKAAP